jgi:hypothetical protein
MTSAWARAFSRAAAPRRPLLRRGEGDRGGGDARLLVGDRAVGLGLGGAAAVAAAVDACWAARRARPPAWASSAVRSAASWSLRLPPTREAIDRPENSACGSSESMRSDSTDSRRLPTPVR